MGVHDESARRVGDCVAYLLNEQPFFGSLALRLPLRPDPSRETLASDGLELRYAPAWVARTDGDRIKTAVARVVLACALKHHTRRGGRDPGRWQRASQCVTHGELRRAGFVLPAEAEAWEDLSVEDAYERLAGEDGAGESNPSGSGGEGAGGNDTSGAGDGGDSGNSGRSDGSGDPAGDSGQDGPTGNDGDSRRPRATTPPAPARSWTPPRARRTTTGRRPATCPSTSPPRSRRGTRPCTRRCASPPPRGIGPGASRRPFATPTEAASTGARCFGSTS